MSEKPKWIMTYENISKFLDKHDKKRRFHFKGKSSEIFSKLREEFRENFIEYILDKEVEISKEWIKRFNREIEELKRNLNVNVVLYAKELKSFLEDPCVHLKKKIFNYMYDLFRNKIDLVEFERTAGAALRTSLRTNMRSIYQGWAIASTLNLLSKEGGYLVYPEQGYLSFERSGKQKLGWIPPNAVIYVESKGFLSFFIEAPRPIGWEDTQDLKRAWNFYTALRPDVLVYGGKVLNIVKLGHDPPIERPHIIIECKELEDWYMRVRDMRGPFAKPLTAEEWRSKWIQGLWDGLADILGVRRAEAVESVKEKRTLRLREPQILILYRKFYNPDIMVLISRSNVPSEIKKELEENNIYIIDNVGFNKEHLRELIDILLKSAKQSFGKLALEVSWETYAILERILKKILYRKESISRDEVIENMVKYVDKNIEDFIEFLES